MEKEELGGKSWAARARMQELGFKERLRRRPPCKRRRRKSWQYNGKTGPSDDVYHTMVER
jgi:hypothetical protein